MDTGGIAFAVVAAVVAAIALFLHFQQARKRPVTGHDKLMAGLWAAVIVLAVGRAMYLLMNTGGDAPPPG